MSEHRLEDLWPDGRWVPVTELEAPMDCVTTAVDVPWFELVSVGRGDNGSYVLEARFGESDRTWRASFAADERVFI